MPKVKSTCEHCGKEMEYFASSYPGGIKRHCSRECYGKACRIWKTCPICGKRFWHYRSASQTHCSRNCSGRITVISNLGVKELPPMFCEQCGKEITGPKWRNRRFCSRKCFGKWLSESCKGIPRPEVAGERPDLQDRIERICKQCGKAFQIKRSRADRRKFCCNDCYVSWQQANHPGSGIDNWNWRGGPESYYGPNWRPQRREARERDSYICQRCGITEEEQGQELDVHHKIPFREFGLSRYEEANDLSNLTCLCNKCHTKERHTRQPDGYRLPELQEYKTEVNQHGCY